MRLDSPQVGGQTFHGNWKIFFDARLLREGEVHPFELYNLADDQGEMRNLIDRSELQPLVKHLNGLALLHRSAGGHRLVPLVAERRVVFDWQSGGIGGDEFAMRFDGQSAGGVSVSSKNGDVTMTVVGVVGKRVLSQSAFSTNARGLGLDGGSVKQVDQGEGLLISFDRAVILESATIVAGNGACGGFYQVGEGDPLAIYCIDADNDSREQQGILSDLGILTAGQKLRLDSGRQLGVEAPGQWRLGGLTIRPLRDRGP